MLPPRPRHALRAVFLSGTLALGGAGLAGCTQLLQRVGLASETSSVPAARTGMPSPTAKPAATGHARRATKADVVLDTPSYWSDPAAMADIDNGWENWPDWRGGGDLTPDTDCSGGNAEAKVMGKAAVPPQPKAAAGKRTASAQAAGDPDKINWKVTIASWNILNFGTSKAYYNKNSATPRTALLDRLADISRPYDVVFFEEILQDWNGAFPAALASRMVGFHCQLIGPELGWAGRKEYYGVCAKPNNATVNSITVAVSSSANACAGGGTCYYLDPASLQSTCPRKIWMRPPGLATVTIVPTDDPTPRVFHMIVNHIKPSYNRSYLPGGGKNPRTPSWYPNARPGTFPAPPAGTVARWPLETAAVYYELQRSTSIRCCWANPI